MQKRNFNLIVSAVTFILGALYIFSDSAGITANVVGSSSSQQGFTAIVGLVVLVASAVFFVHAINTHDVALETLIRRSDNKHDEIRTHMQTQELEEKYRQDNYKEEVKSEKIKQ